MGRKSKAIAVPEYKEIDEKESDEHVEKYFMKLLQDTKTERHRVPMKFILENFKSDDSGLANSIRSVFMLLFIVICELEKERDEAQSKLREYEKGQA